jgi:hypothetical protein
MKKPKRLIPNAKTKAAIKAARSDKVELVG